MNNSSSSSSSLGRRVLVLSILAAAIPACGVFGADDATPPPAVAETPAPGAVPPGSDASTPATPPAAPPLDGTPTVDEINESFGVFVATSGSASGDGSRKAPFATITDGLAHAKAAGKRLYVCEGKYTESITIVKGIGMVGGFDCSTDPTIWKKTPKSSRVESPTSPAITATDIDAPTRLEGFDVFAPDGTTAAPTSIGLLAKHAPALTIASCKINAGRGADGASGVDGAQLSNSPYINGGAGKDARLLVGNEQVQLVLQSGGLSGTNVCVGAAGFVGYGGGGGGAGGGFTCNGYYWVQNASNPFLPGGAGNGATGANGADGLSGSAGTITADGFVPGDGASGTSGAPGLGGKGGDGAPIPVVGAACASGIGSGTNAMSASGPGGGAGGCPGVAGTAGKGGGASIGALISTSDGLVIASSQINAALGGGGGRGTLGSSPTVGGVGAAQGAATTTSGNGGKGGRAGVSGSGAGGASYGIVYHDGAPKLIDDSVAKAGKGGAGVAAESMTDALGNAKTRAASSDGATQDMHDF